MGTLANIGVVQSEFIADTTKFDGSVERVRAGFRGAGEDSDKYAAKADSAFKTVGASADRTAKMQERAVERARAAFQRELLAQDQRIAKEQEAARAAEMAALKNDILARSEEKVAAKADLAKSALVVLGAVMAARSVVSFVDNIARSQVELGHLADKTGIAITTLSGLREIAKENGDDFEAISTGLIRMARNLADSAHPAAQLQQALAGIHLSAKELQGLSIEQQLQKIAAAFAVSSNEGNKANAAIAIFGRGGQALIPILNQQGSALLANARAMGELTGATGESVAASERWMKDEARVELVAQKAGIFIVENANKVLAVFDAIGAAIQTVMTVAVTAFWAIGDELGDIFKIMRDSETMNITALKGDLQDLMRDGIDIVKTGVAEIGDIWKDVGNLWSGTGAYTPPSMAASHPDVSPSDITGSGAKSTKPYIYVPMGGTPSQTGAGAAYWKWRRQQETQEAVENADKTPIGGAGATWPFAQSSSNVTLAKKPGQWAVALDTLRTNTLDLADKFTNLGNILSQNVTTAINDFNNTLMHVLSTPANRLRGEHPWRQMGAGIAQDAGRSALQFGEGEVLKALFGKNPKAKLGTKDNPMWVKSAEAGAGGAGGSGGMVSTGLLGAMNNSDFFGNLFGGKLFGSGGIFANGIPGFADGGMIPSNMPVMVGERGPELLAGAGGRSVIPNGSLGGVTHNHYYNIDARGATDPAAVHAAAMRGAAVGRAQAMADYADRKSRVPPSVARRM